MNNAKSKSIKRSPITIDNVGKGEFTKPGTLTAQLRQVLVTTSMYAAKQTSNELQGGLFGQAAFGKDFMDKPYESTENRVAWVPVPDTMTAEQIAAQIEAANKGGACIYRVLSSRPILTKNQEYSIRVGQKTYDDYADAQVMRYPTTDKTLADNTANKLILNEGKPQYRKTFFWPSAKADQDLRDNANVYISPTMEAEIATEVSGAATFAGQQIGD